MQTAVWQAWFYMEHARPGHSIKCFCHFALYVLALDHYLKTNAHSCGLGLSKSTGHPYYWIFSRTALVHRFSWQSSFDWAFCKSTVALLPQKCGTGDRTADITRYSCRIDL